MDQARGCVYKTTWQTRSMILKNSVSSRTGPWFESEDESAALDPPHGEERPTVDVGAQLVDGSDPREPEPAADFAPLPKDTWPVRLDRGAAPVGLSGPGRNPDPDREPRHGADSAVGNLAEGLISAGPRPARDGATRSAFMNVNCSIWAGIQGSVRFLGELSAYSNAVAMTAITAEAYAPCPIPQPSLTSHAS